MFRPNPIKARLAQGKKCLGLWLVSNNALAAEVAGRLGYDFVIVDHEHGPGDLMGLIGQLHALAAGGGAAAPSAFVRVPWNDPVYIKRALDAGAEGIMIPYVQNAEEAAAAVAACKYPPDGMRGCAIGAIRATGWGHEREAYWRGINEQVVVMPQIETPQGVENIAEIAAVPGVDVLFIGPNDLTVTAGYDPLKPQDEGRALIARAEAAITDAGKPMAVVTYYGGSIDDMFQRGYDMVMAGSELSLLRAASAPLLEAHRKAHG